MHPPLLTTVEITRASRAESPDEVEPPNATAFETWLARRFYFMLPATFSVVAQVELEDGTSAASSLDDSDRSVEMRILI